MQGYIKTIQEVYQRNILILKIDRGSLNCIIVYSKNMQICEKQVDIRIIQHNNQTTQQIISFVNKE